MKPEGFDSGSAPRFRSSSIGYEEASFKREPLDRRAPKSSLSISTAYSTAPQRDNLGAAAGIFPAALVYEIDAAANQVREIDPAAQFINKGLRKSHVLRPSGQGKKFARPRKIATSGQAFMKYVESVLKVTWK